MIDTLKLAERIERELHITPAAAQAAAHIAREVLQEATAEVASKDDLRLALADQKTSIVMWVAGVLVAHAMVTVGATLTGVFFLLNRFLPPT